MSGSSSSCSWYCAALCRRLIHSFMQSDSYQPIDCMQPGFRSTAMAASPHLHAIFGSSLLSVSVANFHPLWLSFDAASLSHSSALTFCHHTFNQHDAFSSTYPTTGTASSYQRMGVIICAAYALTGHSVPKFLCAAAPLSHTSSQTN